MSLRLRFGGLCLTLFWILVYGWLAAEPERNHAWFRYRGKQGDYYNLLVEGMLNKQLSLNLPVHPDLLSKDPAIRARAPFALDAALYQGKYYLYYGVVPAVLLLLPYTALTGQELGMPVACLLFVILGFVLSVRWYVRMLRETGPPRLAELTLLGVCQLAILPATTFLFSRGGFYELPAAAGYAATCVFWLFVAQALRPGNAARSLGWASLAFGLMVGCRPNMILNGFVLLVVAILAARRKRLAWGSALAAAMLPAMGVGVLLGWYNFARFGNPLEFGFNYGCNPFFTSGNPLYSWHFLAANFRWYLLTPPPLAPQFPFVQPIGDPGRPARYSGAEDMHGYLALTVLLVAVVIIWLACRRGRRAVPAAGGALIPLLLIAASLQAGFLFFLGIRATRYAVDFLTPLALLAPLLTLESYRAGPPGLGRRLVLGATTLVAGMHVILGAVQLFRDFENERPHEFAFISRLLNPSTRTMSLLGLSHPGPARIRFLLHKPTQPVIAPLLTTGTPGYSDALRVIVHPTGHFALEIFHENVGGQHTDLIPVEWERPYEVVVSMGSLYPEANDPYFRRWPPGTDDRLRSRYWLSLDGKPLLDGKAAFFRGTPGARQIGGSYVQYRAQGEVVEISEAKVGLKPFAEILAKPAVPPALYTLHLTLLPVDVARPMPLVCSGVSGHGNLVFFDPVPRQRYRLGVDEWGGGVQLGSQFDAPIGRLITVQILIGPALALNPDLTGLLGEALASRLKQHLLVWIDGKLAVDFNLRENLDSYDQILIGKNQAGFSSACDDFGEIVQDPDNEKNRNAILSLVHQSY